jgi:hypothetical protein
MRYWFALAVLTAFELASSSAFGQNRRPEPLTIELGGIEVSLGMPQEDVLRRLSAAYQTTYSENSKSWDVIGGTGTQPRFIGSLTFQAARLVMVVKEWWQPIGSDTASAHAVALRNALESVTKTSGSACKVTPQPEHTLQAIPGMTSAVTWIQCGRRTIELVSSSDGRMGPTVREILE